MERFEYVSSLGEGAYGVVWLCADRETGKQVAMKRFKDAHEDPEVMRLALREVRLLKLAQHPNVVKMLEAFRSKSGRVYIAMEHVDHTLTQEMRRWHGKGFPPLLAKSIIWQLLQATQFLHSRKIMHRDFKPANILLTKDNELRVCDFGFARQLHPREVAEYTTYVVTRWYRAPEILVSDSYGPKVDVWAAGCLLCEMMGGRPLFPGKSSADQMWLTMRTLGALPPRQAALMSIDKLYTGFVAPTPAERTSIAKRFPQFADDLLDLLHGCLALDPSERLTAAEALAHPFFADVPQTLEAIATCGKPAPAFWSEVEEAWQRAVAATGNNVCTPSFMRTSVKHAQLSTILMRTSDMGRVSMAGGEAHGDESSPAQARLVTPSAPVQLVRRNLLGMSVGSAGGWVGTASSVCSMAGPESEAPLSAADASMPVLSKASMAVAPLSSRTSGCHDCPGQHQPLQHRLSLNNTTSSPALATHEGGATHAAAGFLAVQLRHQQQQQQQQAVPANGRSNQLSAYINNLDNGGKDMAPSASHPSALSSNGALPVHRSRFATVSQPAAPGPFSGPDLKTSSLPYGLVRHSITEAAPVVTLSSETPSYNPSMPSLRNHGGAGSLSRASQGAANYSADTVAVAPKKGGSQHGGRHGANGSSFAAASPADSAVPLRAATSLGGTGKHHVAPDAASQLRTSHSGAGGAGHERQGNASTALSTPSSGFLTKLRGKFKNFMTNGPDGSIVSYPAKVPSAFIISNYKFVPPVIDTSQRT